MVRSGAVIVLATMLCASVSFGQASLGAEVRGTYVEAYRAVLPGIAGAYSTRIGKRASFKVDAGWHLPRTDKVSQVFGPAMLQAGDTTSRVVTGRARKGMMGIAAGIQGDLSKKRRNAGGLFWETMLAFDAFTRWSETTTRYIHTGEIGEQRGTTYATMLSLRTDVGYGMPLGAGQMRFVLSAAPVALDLSRSGRNRINTFPLFGAGVVYQWKVAAKTGLP
jgi:hypothetical protein